MAEHDFKQDDFRSFAGKALAGIYEAGDHERIYAHLKSRAGMFAAIPTDIFGLEYLASRLATGCVAWDACCRENHLAQESAVKAFLKAAMDSFQSPKFLPVASAFSDYLYGRAADESGIPVVSVTAHFFKRIKFPASDPAMLQEAFRALLEVLETFRMSFANDFEEFLTQRLLKPGDGHAG